MSGPDGMKRCLGRFAGAEKKITHVIIQLDQATLGRSSDYVRNFEGER